MAGATRFYRFVTQGRIQRARVHLACLVAAAALVILAVIVQPASAQPSASITQADTLEFNIWKQRFLMPDGRVVDTGNGGISHSEGQSYGLLLSEAFNDRASFGAILEWTRLHLRRPYDQLFAWKYKPGQPNPVSDLNNATDGDIIIAWALLRAGKAWNVPQYTKMGKDLASAILRLCVATQNGRLVLLPAEHGFAHSTHTVFNLSYYVFAAFRAMAEAVPDPRWQQLEYDGRRLIAASQFGPWRLPADWESLAENAPEQPADGWPARFSWDAVRVPLHTVWAGITNDPGPVWNATRFWSAQHAVTLPAWADLLDPAMAPYSGHNGIRAVAMLSAAAILHKGSRNDLPSVTTAPDYYAGSLIMLSRLAWIEAIDQPPAPIPYPIAPVNSAALVAALSTDKPAPEASATVPPDESPGVMANIYSMLGLSSGDDAKGKSDTDDKPASSIAVQR